MPFEVLRDISLGDEGVYRRGSVIDDWRVPDFVRRKLEDGDPIYLGKLTPLSPAAASRASVRRNLDPVGLHPNVHEHLVGMEDRLSDLERRLIELERGA